MDEVRCVQLPQQTDRLALRGSGVAELVAGDSPGLGHRATAVEQTDEAIRGVVEAEELIAGRILNHLPQLAAEVLAMNLNRRPQTRTQTRHTVPRLAECRTINRHNDNPTAKTGEEKLTTEDTESTERTKTGRIKEPRMNTDKHR